MLLRRCIESSQDTVLHQVLDQFLVGCRNIFTPLLVLPLAKMHFPRLRGDYSGEINILQTMEFSDAAYITDRIAFQFIVIDKQNLHFLVVGSVIVEPALHPVHNRRQESAYLVS